MTPSQGPSLGRVCIGLGLWCVGLTVFTARVWVRNYVLECQHTEIFHRSSTSIDDCSSLFSRGGVLRSAPAFWELLLLIAVVAVPLIILAPVLLRAARARP